MLKMNIKPLKKLFKNPKFNFAILICFLLLGLWQVNRSSISGTFIYVTHIFHNHISHAGKVSGEVTARLNIARHRQEHSLSCEIAALKMALAGYGLNVSESELISRLPFTSMRGDPNEAFVGDIDGRMASTGYGVYWNPIAKVANAYLRSEVFQASPGLVASHIIAGRPVIMWGYFGRGNKISWTTPAGKQIVGINGEHARTVVGFTGSVDAPDGFIVIDPIYGEEFWTASELFGNWQPFNNMGVVVYPHSKWVKAQDDSTIWEISSDASIKYPLAMSWNRFLEYGGIPDGVKTVSEAELAAMKLGQIVY
jgi:uncharacterized protein YvpB